jgi:uncharacterized phage-associated protein
MHRTEKYSPAHVANYFLWRAWRENIEITPMKLIKLVYIAYGWNLVINNDEKLFEEPIFAWEYGPVIKSIYHEFKRFGSKPISKDNYAADFNINTGELLSVPIVPGNDEDTIDILNAEWQNYKNKSGPELSRITHKPGSAWCKAWNNGEGKNAILDDNEIKIRSLEAINSLMKESELVDG